MATPMLRTYSIAVARSGSWAPSGTGGVGSRHVTKRHRISRGGASLTSEAQLDGVHRVAFECPIAVLSVPDG